jgi:hypothetical protein
MVYVAPFRLACRRADIINTSVQNCAPFINPRQTTISKMRRQDDMKERREGEGWKALHLEWSGRLEVLAAHECGQLWKTQLEPVVFLEVVGDRNLSWGFFWHLLLGPFSECLVWPRCALCSTFVVLLHPIEPADTTLIQNVAHSFELAELLAVRFRERSNDLRDNYKTSSRACFNWRKKKTIKV